MNLESDYLDGEDDGDYGPDLRHPIPRLTETRRPKSTKSRDTQTSYNFNRHMIDLYNKSRK